MLCGKVNESVKVFQFTNASLVMLEEVRFLLNFKIDATYTGQQGSTD